MRMVLGVLLQHTNVVLDHIYTHTHIHAYIHSERDKEERDNVQLTIHTQTYIHIHTRNAALHRASLGSGTANVTFTSSSATHTRTHTHTHPTHTHTHEHNTRVLTDTPLAPHVSAPPTHHHVTLLPGARLGCGGVHSFRCTRVGACCSPFGLGGVVSRGGGSGRVPGSSTAHLIPHVAIQTTETELHAATVEQTDIAQTPALRDARSEVELESVSRALLTRTHTHRGDTYTHYLSQHPRSHTQHNPERPNN